MTEELETRVSKTGEHKHYYVILERPASPEHKVTAFNEFFVDRLEELFRDKHTEQQILDFLKNCPYRIPIKKRWADSVEKYKGVYYKPCQKKSFPNFDNATGLCISLVEKVDFAHYNSIAVRNLMSTIQDEDLSLGDKKLIRDIAIASFHQMLEIAVTPEVAGSLSFDMCLATSLHEPAALELRRYGFKIKEDKFYDVNLTRL